ncbi:5-deoxy-glucuronate isomerase, partial [Anaerostipes sp. CAG:276]
IGDIHQIHGEGVGRREVMFTLAPQDTASKLICGLTWSQEGAWTSWPPHQHEKDLEEVYCYFDMPSPKFGLHISYLKTGEVEDIVTHTVHSGTMVQAPCGYHPTVASPGSRNAYFWVLAAFTPESRRYDLAINDPAFEQ